MTQYLDIADIEKIRNILNLEESEKPYNYKGGLELTLSTVQDLFEDIKDKKTKVVSKAAYLIKEITRGHFFNGGNKRTALYATRVFLNINGFNLKYDEGAGFLLTIGIIYNQKDKKSLIDWMLNHLEEPS